MKNDSWVPPLICYSYISIHHKQWKLRNVNLKKKTIEGGVKVEATDKMCGGIRSLVIERGSCCLKDSESKGERQCY